MEENVESTVSSASISAGTASGTTEANTEAIAESSADVSAETGSETEASESESSELLQATATETAASVAGDATSALSPTVNISEFSGSMGMKIPLEVPPGRLKMAPQLSLTYDNYHANGWIGVGWVLDMGAIQRSTKHGLSYSANDYMAAINGSSSDLVARSDWGTNYYGARIEGALSKYYFNTTTGGWEVTSKDGTKYYYGTTAASRQDFDSGAKVFKWCLDKVQDTNGNYVTVTYTKDQGEIYLARIDYTGNSATSLSTTNYVKFYLEDRTDGPLMFEPNYQVKTAKRLKTIEVRAGSSMVRAYSLTYVTSGSTSRSLVSAVRVYGSDTVLDTSGTIMAGTALPPLSISSGESQTPSFTNGPLFSLADVASFSYFWFGDFNGDGKTDILYMPAGSNARVKFSSGDGTFTDGPLFSLADVASFSYFWLGDFNGDGKTDILYMPTGSNARVKFSNGDGTFTNGPLFSVADVASFSYFWLGDFNGDGKTDILYMPTGSNARVKFSNGDGTFTDGPLFSLADVASFRYFWLADFNGDGKTDILYLPAGPNARVKFSNGDGTFTDGPLFSVADVASFSYFWLGDFNGDGKTDILYMPAGSNARVKFSSGDGTFTDGPLFSLADVASFSYWWLGDFNGDGKTDILYLPAGPNGRVKFSNGDGTFTDGPLFDVSDVASFNYWWRGDFTGDGKTDILYMPAGSNARVKFATAGLDMPLSLTTPIGGTAAITYTPSSSYSNTLMPMILQTVSAVTNSDGRGASYTTNYTYSSGLFDYTEREFRGFGYAKASQMRDTQNYEAKTETWFLQDYTRKGMAQEVLTTSREGHTRRVDNTWTAATLVTGVTYPRLDLTQSTVTDVGYTPYSYAVAYTYDSTYLNVTDEHKTGMVAADEMHTYYAYTAFTTPWIVAKPTDIKITDASGNIKSRKWMDYDSTTGNLTEEEVCKSDTPETDGLSRNATVNPVTTYLYYSEGNVSSATDPRGNTTTFTYDTATKTFVSTATNALGHVTTKTYNPGTGKPLTLIPPHLQGTAYNVSCQYDVFGRITQETRPDGGYTTYQYLNIGTPTTQHTDTMEHITGGASALDNHAYTYFDGLGRTYTGRSTGPDTKTIVADTAFDVMGRVSQKSNPYFLTIDTPVYTQIAYDGLSRVITTTYPDTSQTTVSYRGLVKQVQDQRQHTTVYTYDVYQRLKATEDAYGTVTQYSYDTLGNLLQVIAASGQTEENTTTMTYDSLSEKRTMTDPDMGYWTYAYDKAGNLVSQTDAKSQTVTFTYDAVNRLTQKIYSGYTVTNTYDDSNITYSKGMLTKTLDPSGSENKENNVLALDVMQRVTQSSKIIGTNSLTLSKTYDTAGRTVTMTYPTGSYTYTYDAAGNVVSLHDNTAGTNHIEYSSYTPMGQPGFAVFSKPGNISVKTTYTYDPNMGRLSTLVTQKLSAGTPVATYQNLAYEFDLKGNITTITDAVNSVTQLYVYDDLDRLVSAMGPGNLPYSQAYAYDRIGNITAKSDVGSYAYTYGSKPHAVRTAGSISLQYDANGNMTQRATTGVTLDIAWTETNKPSLIQKNGTNYIRFTYDGNGDRVRKENLSTGSVTRYYGEVYEERGTVGIINLFANNHRIVSVRSDGYLQYYHGNHIGSASVVTDASGDRKETIEYYPFGTYRDRQDYDPSFPNVNYTFTDQEDDDETGLYNYKARLYDPILGRFISADSIVPQPGNLQALNRYSYCVNNPLVYVDPSGHDFGLCAFIIAVLIGAAVGAGVSAAMGGDIGKGALTGAISAAVFYGAGVLIQGIRTSASLAAAIKSGGDEYAIAYATQNSISKLGEVGIYTGAGAVAGGVNAAITSGNIPDMMLKGAASAAVFQFMAIASDHMRLSMIEQSKLDPRNASGQSEGFRGDEFKLAGCRINPSDLGAESPLGGAQGGPGKMFGIPYDPGSFVDYIAEAWAGPHDYLNHGFWYDKLGVIRQGMNAFEVSVGEALNWINVAVAAPFAIAGIVRQPALSIAYNETIRSQTDRVNEAR